jgi:hypothetical protein
MRWYVDQQINGRTVTTLFYKQDSAEAFAKAIGECVRGGYN